MVRHVFILYLLCLMGEKNFCHSQGVQRYSISILNEEAEPTAARIRFTDLEGHYIAPVGHDATFSVTHANDPVAVEKGVLLDEDRRFAYVEGTFEIDLPKRPVRVEVVKGYHYRIIDDTLDVALAPASITLPLEKWGEWPDDSWYSGDVHVHYINPETALLEMKAEDLQVCNILISDFTVDQDQFRGSIDPISEPGHIVYFGQEFREDQLGHVNLLNIKDRLVEPVKPIREHQYPLNMSAYDQIHSKGGHLSWAHFAAWPGLEGPLAAVLRKLDAVELLCTIDPFHEPIFAAQVVPEVRMNSGLKLWYRLLNCGLRIPITAGTDKMNNQVTVGGNRVFAQVEGAFTYASWIQALNEGKTFVSNTPFLTLNINEAGPGSTLESDGTTQYHITAEVWSQLPLDRLEIIVNGELLAEIPIAKGEHHAILEWTFQPTESAWIAARAYQFSRPDVRRGLSFAQRRDAGGGPTLFNRYFGTLRPETVFAHTSPVYMIVQDQPIRSAEDAHYFVHYLSNALKWLEVYGSFPNESAKQEVLEAFRSGKAAFEALTE